MTICLTMIVRDEEQTVAACLESARPVIDSWVICDTGSEDRTREVVADTLDGIPGVLVDREWRGFGPNRTEALRLADGSGDYLLMLDADMRIERRGPLPELVADEYMLRSVGAFEFTLPLLLKSGRAWEYRGAAHSYLACADGRPVASAELEQLRIIDTREGGFRPGKFERDAELLERELADDPSNARAVFYLAQTYRDLGRDQDAADMYRRRVEMGGWDEEVFWANYQEALCRQALGDDPTDLLLEAWQRRPHRAEPLYVLAKHHRENGRPDVAVMFADRGVNLPPPNDRLFVLRWIYDSGIRRERELALQALEGRLAA